jgi:hypothetical protein
MTTRAQILADAFEAIGIADYVFNVTPTEAASARRGLDSMLAQWGAEGVALGYTPSDETAGSDAVEMTTPVWADKAISNNLAVHIAPGFGKTPLAETKRAAKVGYGLCVAKTLKTPREVRPVPIRGAGDSRWFRSIETLT